MNAPGVDARPAAQADGKDAPKAGLKEAARPLVRAAGALPWRYSRGRLQVALVHRSRYDDWSWAKGKLDAGEDWPAAGVREVLEETAWRVRLGRPLPAARYDVSDRTGGRAPKEVRYWAAEVIGGDGKLRHEVDRVRWVTPGEAVKLLSYPRDHEQLDALVHADAHSELRTWPLVVVRHAKARSRASWKGKDDRQRPLTPRGRAQADDVTAVLSAYAVSRVVTSPSTRCVQTVSPYGRQDDRIRFRTADALSEEGFERNPAEAAHIARALLDLGAATAVCSHGPVLPRLVGALASAAGGHADETVRAGLVDVAANNLSKGEVLVAHVAGYASGARIVALERHLPIR